MIYYGYNNSGKTTFLKVLNHVFSNRMLESFLKGHESEMAVYIPTNRLTVSQAVTEATRFKDLEDFIQYQQDAYRDYGLHLKNIRNRLLVNPWVGDFICRTIQKIFGIKLEDIHDRYSDGIENIINIYLTILWTMTWDLDLADLSEERLDALCLEKEVYVMIDEIEMFLHVNVQAKLLNSLKDDFRSCRFILTTHSPLLLTRYKNTDVYNIVDGELRLIEDELYYQDLNVVYEGFFSVKELPQRAAEDINFLGSVVLRRQAVEPEKIATAAKDLEENYPNLFRKYNRIITKAQNVGDGHGRD